MASRVYFPDGVAAPVTPSVPTVDWTYITCVDGDRLVIEVGVAGNITTDGIFVNDLLTTVES